MADAGIYDVAIIGGGPAGATAGVLLARAGIKAVILEKTNFPRFHIGESLLPRNMPLIQELGLEHILENVPKTRKLGAEFVNGDGDSSRFGFEQGLIPGSPTFNIERAPFDEALLNEARKVGAEVREGVAVKEILRMKDGDVALSLSNGDDVRAKYLFDASGQHTFVGRHLKTRQNYPGRHLHKVAYFAHFENVRRRAGKEAGHPCIVMCEEGWFWLIPIDEKRTSIGLVMGTDITKQAGVPANRMLKWGIERCPAVMARASDRVGPDTNEIISNFSYHCRPYAGDGHFLLGDAAAFLDPIFSSGVCLGMISARAAVEQVIDLLHGKISPSTARARYIRAINEGLGVFFNLINQYYNHSFRELFLDGEGPLDVHRAVLSVLAGQVFPVAWKLRWRLWLFGFFVWANQYFKLVPRRTRFSLLQHEPITSVERVPELV